jgi:hypothetical protein
VRRRAPRFDWNLAGIVSPKRYLGILTMLRVQHWRPLWNTYFYCIRQDMVLTMYTHTSLIAFPPFSNGLLAVAINISCTVRVYYTSAYLSERINLGPFVYRTSIYSELLGYIPTSIHYSLYMYMVVVICSNSNMLILYMVNRGPRWLSCMLWCHILPNCLQKY